MSAIARALELRREDGRLALAGDPEAAAGLCFGLMTDGPRIRSVIGDPMSRTELQRHVAAAVDLFLAAHGGAKAAMSRKPARK